MYIKSNVLFKSTCPERIFDNVPRPIIIADHLLTPDNMGSMIRLADNIGASEMCFLGVSPTHSLSKVKKAAASSKDNIKWYYTEENDLRKIAGNKTIVAIETSDDAECIFDCELPSDIAFVVGNESRGIREEILCQCDKIVYIPVPGPTRSLNVSHATAVAIFEWQRQMILNFDSDYEL